MIPGVLEDSLEAIAARSLVNCHAVGVDSIVLDPTQGRLVRVFVAGPDHTLWQNGPNLQGLPFSVALHTHHCDVRLTRVYGVPMNVEAEVLGQGAVFRGYRFSSAIRGGTGRFESVDRRLLARLVATPIRFEPTVLSAQDLHTIYVARGQEAAWFVQEGAEDPAYDPTAFSNADLTQFDPEALGLYRPMSVGVLRGHLARLGFPVVV